MCKLPLPLKIVKITIAIIHPCLSVFLGGVNGVEVRIYEHLVSFYLNSSFLPNVVINCTIRHEKYKLTFSVFLKMYTYRVKLIASVIVL